MKGVVPSYLLLKERKAVYMFSTGVVVSCGPSESCVTLSGVTLSGEVACRLFDEWQLNRQRRVPKHAKRRIMS